jgi:hypothetical protein
VPDIDPDDWRLTQGADEFLRSATLRWQAFEKPRPDWDHEHCSFCWAKFVEPDDYDWYLQQGKTDGVYTEGYATTAEHEKGEAYYWVCKPCFDHFAEYVGLRIAA